MFMCLLFVNPSVVSAQSKKQQIFILKGKLDSLKEENIQTKYHLDISRRLEIRNKQEIDSLENILNIQERKLNANKFSYESDLKRLQRELDFANLSLKKNQRDLDSIASLLVDPKLISDYVNSENEITYSSLNVPSRAEMVTIEDWLAQFTLLSDNEISFFDAKIARFYGGDEPLDVHGQVSISTEVYKEGIVYVSRGEYEGVTYELFVPLLELSDVRKIADRLFRNMGMCISPEEMNIRYEETDYGIKVYWGGGC